MNQRPPAEFMKAFLCCMIMFGSLARAAESDSPYSGQEQREVKSLSARDIQAYLEGSGMGYAKAAELNHYPGPKHVLELAEELGLSEGQVAETQRIFKSMKQQASDLGAQLVASESRLDRQFADRTVTDPGLHALLIEIARLEGEIRYTHLAAHLAQKQILSESQVRHYDHLRGYGAGHKKHDH